ncbi:MAG: alpha/beta hydrolase [Gemmatimonadales bacterium]|nr:alpha/beta hydrolase [Gemmatimonadales bacterium]
MSRKWTFAVAMVALGGCGGEKPAPITPPPSAAWIDPSPHASRFVAVPGARLHVLDWGGTGPALILIHGLGDNPHVFDGVVPALPGFRLVAYARRGHGRSSKEGPFDTATLVADLTALMDSLGIAKAHLAGWSMGGNEVTGMAGTHPDRVGKLVYLDAGYDWADPAVVAAFAESPVDFTPKPEVLASMDAFRAWQLRSWFPAVADSGVLEAYFRDWVEPQPDGTVRPSAPDSVSGALFEALTTNHRDYSKVRASALAIYAEAFFDLTRGDSAQRARNAGWEAKHLRAFRAASIERLKRELPSVEVMTVPGTHADFMFTSQAPVTAAIRRFLTAP